MYQSKENEMGTVLPTPQGTGKGMCPHFYKWRGMEAP